MTEKNNGLTDKEEEQGPDLIEAIVESLEKEGTSVETLIKNTESEASRSTHDTENDKILLQRLHKIAEKKKKDK